MAVTGYNLYIKGKKRGEYTPWKELPNDQKKIWNAKAAKINNGSVDDCSDGKCLLKKSSPASKTPEVSPSKRSPSGWSRFVRGKKRDEASAEWKTMSDEEKAEWKAKAIKESTSPTGKSKTPPKKALSKGKAKAKSLAKDQLAAGIYYVGDLSFLFADDDDWNAVEDMVVDSDNEYGIYEYKGIRFFCDDTGIEDGIFGESNLKLDKPSDAEYKMETGLFGAFPFNKTTGIEYTKKSERTGGLLKKFPVAFKCKPSDDDEEIMLQIGNRMYYPGIESGDEEIVVDE